LTLIILSVLAAAPTAAHARASARDALDWGQCRKDDWLDFFLPSLPRDVAREGAATDIDAAHVSSTDDKHYKLEGNVDIRRGDQRVTADEATFDQEKNHAEASGHVHYQDSKLLIAGDKAVSDLDQSKSRIEPAKYQLIESRGNGDATLVETLDKQRSHLTDATYSTCELGSNAWRIGASEIWLDQETGVGRARNMTVRVKDVPVLYLPYARFPIDDRRQSGFLYPNIGGSNAGGLDLALPYYLNLAPNYDATLEPRLVGHRGLMLGGEFRYLEPTFKGQLSGTWLPSDRDHGDDTRGCYHLEHTQTFSPNFYFQANIQRASDTRYFEDFGNSLASAATSLLPAMAYLYGRGPWWNLSFGADKIQVTDPLLPATAEPYHRMPRFTLEADHELGVDWLHAGIKTELVRFDKGDTLLTLQTFGAQQLLAQGATLQTLRLESLRGNRYDVYPYLALPFETTGYFIRPEIGVRSTRYDLDIPYTPQFAGNTFLQCIVCDDHPSRTTPIASLDAGMFFERDTSWFGRAFTQTLEPRIYYLRVPYRNQDDLPLFDTQELTFGFADLFRSNRFSGADRQINANQLTLAVTTRLVEDADGSERARLSVGQIRYFDEPRVSTALPAGPDPDLCEQLGGLDCPSRDERHESAFVGELDVKLSDKWNATFEQQYDPHLSHTDFSGVRLQHFFARDGVVNASYRYRRDLLEQVDLSAAVPISDAWKLVGRYDYSLRDSRLLEAFGGFEYDSCCYAARLVVRRYLRNAEGDSTNAIYFEIELKGLGGFGRASEQFLRRAILGYSQDR
jgi:LPS-assembly protein